MTPTKVYAGYTEYEIDILDDDSADVQEYVYSIAPLPTPTASLAGKIYKYSGETTADYINGKYYICTVDEQDSSIVTWEECDPDWNGHLRIFVKDNTVYTECDGTYYDISGTELIIDQVIAAELPVYSLPTNLPEAYVGKEVKYVGPTTENYISGTTYRYQMKETSETLSVSNSRRDVYVDYPQTVKVSFDGKSSDGIGDEFKLYETSSASSPTVWYAYTKTPFSSGVWYEVSAVPANRIFISSTLKNRKVYLMIYHKSGEWVAV